MRITHKERTAYQQPLDSWSSYQKEGNIEGNAAKTKFKKKGKKGTADDDGGGGVG